MTGSPLLQVENLTGGYGDTIVLRGVSFSLGRGEVVGILGRNGVGKTTLMRLVTGTLPLSAGTLVFDGKPLDGLKPYERAGAGISYAPQENVVFDDLTVGENLTLRTPGLARYEPLFASFPQIPRRLGQKAGTLSGGEKKIVTFVRALAEASPLTLLDEPTEGVQQENLDRMTRHVADRCREGAAFVIVEQNLGFLLALMHQVCVLDHGVVVHSAARFSRDELDRYLHV